jgi:hypothetical protein
MTTLNKKSAKLISLTNIEAKILPISNFAEMILFKKISLLGIEIPEMHVNKKDILAARPYLLAEGLLNEEDDVFEELKCDFYKQMLHGVLWEIRVQREVEFERMYMR